MYSIDINLLKERPELGGGATPTVTSGGSNIPIILGGVAALFFIGLVLLGSAAVSFWVQQLALKEQEVEDQLAAIAPDLQKMDELKKEQQQITAETQAFAKAFNEIKPWSAVLTDLGAKTPTGMQIIKISQSPTGNELVIDGRAASFNDVNDFVLLLQNQSAFIDGPATKLATASRAGSGEDAPSEVNFSLNTAISTIPASELIEELEANGAEGLVSRINFLKEQGVVKQ